MSIVVLKDTWIQLSQVDLLYRWKNRNGKNKIVCFMNDGCHLFTRKDNSWIHIAYNKFRRPKLITNSHECVFLRHGGHHSSKVGTVKIFVYGSVGIDDRPNRKCSVIMIPANHICFIAVYCGKLVSQLIVPL